MATINSTKLILGLLILAAVILLVAALRPSQSFGASPAGSTFSDAKVAMVSVNLANAGANGTSTSILNTDGNDRYITGYQIGCETVGTSKTAYTGSGLAALQLTIGTTTAANSATIPSANLVVNAGTVATSSVYFLQASSTLQTGSITSAIWGANTPLDFWFNATNTATCAVGVSYVGS